MQKIWKITPHSVLHVGAHRGEESTEYQKFGFGHITWVEAQPDLVKELRDRLDQKHNSLIEAAVWNQADVEMEFNVATNGESSSLLEFGTHRESYPEISFTKVVKVRTKRLQDIISADFASDFLNLDIQGAELQALQGLGARLHQFKWVYTEVNNREVYKGCANISELDAYLCEFKFKRVATRWVYGHGWGDALYVSESELVNLPSKLRLVFSQLGWQLKSAKWYLAGLFRSSKEVSAIQKSVLARFHK